MMESGQYLSRGQRKRLQKKEKFVNQKFLESKHSKLVEAEQLKEKQK